MTAVGGSIEEIEFAGRTYAVPGDNEAQLKIGGFENEVQPNGNGTARLIKTRAVNQINGLLVEIDYTNGDFEFLQEAADRNDFEVISITLADGTVYQGRSQIVGELQGSTQSATASVSFAGPQKLTQQ